MDVKDIQGHEILHIIDHGTRYFSVTAQIPNKESSSLVRCIFKYWLYYFGTTEYFLSNNKKELDSQQFRDMA